MSYIANSKNELMIVKDIFNEIRKDRVNVDLLEEIVIELLPKDNNGDILVGYKLSECNGGISSFYLSNNYLNLSIDNMYEWIDSNVFVSVRDFNIKDIDLFKVYMFLYVICHEIEHSYQYLMAYDVIEGPCELVSSGYKLIIDTLICRNYDKLGKLKIFRNMISHYLYYKNSYRYVIERNANVEAFDLLQKLAIENNHDELAIVFNNMRNSFAMWGYMNNNKGCFYDTCNNMLLGYEYKRLNHNYELSDIDRFRYGLDVSSEFMEGLKLIRRR